MPAIVTSYLGVTMQRLIQLSAILAAGFITFGLYALPDAPLMQLASHSPEVYMLRWVIIVGCLALLATKPPRASFFRGLIGTAAIGFFLWTTYALYVGDFPLLDGLLFMIASVSFGLAALEVAPVPASKKGRVARA